MPQRATTLSRIRLRHLQCFLAVAQLGNLRRAAQALAITQPAVTKTINELEDLLGAALFVRGRKGATLTPEGEAFLPHANASVNALGQAVDSVLAGPGEPALRLGVLPTIAPSFVPQVLRGFAALRPQAALRVHTGRNKLLIDMLRGRELDAVIGRLSDPDAMAGVTFEHLYAEPLVIVVRPGHPFVLKPARGRPPLAALASCPMVLPLAGTMIRQLADGFLERHGLAPRAGLVETLDTSLARALVAGGDHLWFTPLGAALPDLEAGTLARLSVAITPEEPVGLMLRTDALPSAGLQALLGIVRHEAAVRRAPPVAARPRGRKDA
ncbi:pca operon transcription factor PcaQ [Piscinibacter sp.]|jgi:LysR family pca operon transcriptional activator|uniref:pca operon transcription factor PcaQ n=1 Tax=Piscinibacter sp. TaxID=1903157 RepID=UPI002F41C579